MMLNTEKRTMKSTSLLTLRVIPIFVLNFRGYKLQANTQIHTCAVNTDTSRLVLTEVKKLCAALIPG